MEPADQVGTTEPSSRLNKVVGRRLYLVRTPTLTPIAAAHEEGSELETITAEWDAPISLWWDQPPCEDPQ